MDEVFLKLINMSIAASWLILAVVLLRFALKKAPKFLRCALWALVAVRLICPFSFESMFSLIPSAETLPQDILNSQSPGITSGIEALNSAVNPAISDTFTPAAGASADPLQVWVSVAGTVWLVGVAAMLLYALVSFLKIEKKVREAAPLKDNVWICDHIDTPFILGVFRPRIYLPSTMEEEQCDYVLTHENAHLKRRDHLSKPLGFLLLSVYWFNPLCWLAYWLLCKDIELACDERVIRDLDAHNKKAYSEALLSCSVPRRMLAACPLAFGEVGVKERIKTVLNYKKPAFWVIVAAVVACVVVAVCFLTNPITAPIEERDEPVLTLNDIISLSEKGEALTWSDFDGYSYRETGSGLYIRVYEIDDRFSLHIGGGLPPRSPMYMRLVSNSGQDDYIDIRTESVTDFIASHEAGSASAPEAEPLDAAISAAILGNGSAKPFGWDFACESHVTLATEANGNGTVTAYALVLYQEYKLSDGAFELTFGSHIPTAFTFDVSENGEYTLVEYWIPRDGSFYAPDIRGKFPPSIAEDAMDTQRYILLQKQNCYAQAVEFFDTDTNTVIEGLLETICSSPTTSSNPGDYISAHPIEYRELTYYGDYALSYVFTKFLKGGQTGLGGHIMRSVMDDLIGGEALELSASTGQEYFDAWRAKAESAYAENGAVFMRENMPRSWLLLQLMGE